MTEIDGWKCEEAYPGTDWAYRTAKRGSVEWCAGDDGLSVSESSHGWIGYTGSYALPANVIVWLMQAVR